MRFRSTISFLALSSSAVSGASSADFKSKCEALGKGVKVQGYNGVGVTIAQYLAKNSTIDQFSEGTNSTCAFLSNPVVPVNLCRLALHVPTTETSDIYMEAWLPEAWNSRFIAVGTGGLAGCEFFQSVDPFIAKTSQVSSTRTSRM
jgi:feruloyl esterase